MEQGHEPRLFVQQTSLFWKDHCIIEKISFFQNDSATASELFGSSENLSKNSNDEVNFVSVIIFNYQQNKP